MKFTALILMLTTAYNKIERSNNLTINHTGKYDPLPQRDGARPVTTDGIPHVQLDLDIDPIIHKEMIRRVSDVPGIKNEPSVILSWKGLWIDDNIKNQNSQALISGREFGHIHDDGSLHIFLEPQRAQEAIESGWAVSHPFATKKDPNWEGFVMLYTPQTIAELDVVFQLIVDGYNYVTGKQIIADMYY